MKLGSGWERAGKVPRAALAPHCENRRVGLGAVASKLGPKGKAGGWDLGGYEHRKEGVGGETCLYSIFML